LGEWLAVQKKTTATDTITLNKPTFIECKRSDEH
jgi:hypothetical protein